MLKRICFWCYWLDVDPYPLRQCLIKITTLGYFCKSFILPQPFCPVYPEIFHVTFHHLRLLPRTDKGKFLFLKFMVMSSASENKSTKSVPVTLTRFCFCFCFFLILLFSLTGLWKAAVDFPCKWLSTSSSQCQHQNPDKQVCGRNDFSQWQTYVETYCSKMDNEEGGKNSSTIILSWSLTLPRRHRKCVARGVILNRNYHFWHLRLILYLSSYYISPLFPRKVLKC